MHRAPTATARRQLIVLHGLGADGNDFVPIAQELDLAGRGRRTLHLPACADAAGDDERRLRHARLVRHRRHAALPRREDEAGLRESQALIEALIERERRTRHAGLAHRADGFFARLRDDAADRAAPRRAAGRAGGPVGLPAAGGQHRRRALGGQCRRADLPGARPRRPDDRPSTARWPRATRCWRWATRWNGTTTRCRIRCAWTRSPT